MTDLRWRFPPELRVMSTVPRWSIVHTLTRDTVANHSFYVTFYTHAIAKLIAWRGDLAGVMLRALLHDAEETITGDIVSPVKDAIIDNGRAESYIQTKLEERMPFVVEDLDEQAGREGEDLDDEGWRIVQAADKIDALIFLLTERRLGNGVIAPHLPRAWARAEARWRALPADESVLDELWNTVVVPAIKDHETNGGAGLL